MTAPAASASSPIVPVEDVDASNWDFGEEQQIGLIQPDDALEHPAAVRGTAMNDAGGQFSNPTTFISGVF